MMRLFRGLDVKFILSLAALLVVGTICFGFVQRGNHITSAEESVSALSAQLGDLSAENRRLRHQLDTIQHRSAARDRQAARERDALLRELVRLNEFLRTHGIDVPAPTVYVTRTYAAPSSPSRSRASGGPGPARSPQPAPAPAPAPHHTAPGNSGGHAHGHKGGKGNKAPRLIALPSIPTLP